MTLLALLLTGGVGLAGAFGAVARYLLGRFVAERVTSQYPIGTFLINITGAFVIGLFFGLVAHKLLSPTLQLILATGFLGGYTTFSTMSWEGVQLVRGGSIRSSVIYLGGSMLVGLVAAFLGILVGGGLR